MTPRFAAIPGGAFLMGSDTGQDDERPVHRVSIDAFALGVYPVTRGEYAAFIAATGHDRPRDWDAAEFAGMRANADAAEAWGGGIDAEHGPEDFDIRTRAPGVTVGARRGAGTVDGLGEGR